MSPIVFSAAITSISATHCDVRASISASTYQYSIVYRRTLGERPDEETMIKVAREIWPEYEWKATEDGVCCDDGVWPTSSLVEMYQKIVSIINGTVLPVVKVSTNGTDLQVQLNDTTRAIQPTARLAKMTLIDPKSWKFYTLSLFSRSIFDCQKVKEVQGNLHVLLTDGSTVVFHPETLLQVAYRVREELDRLVPVYPLVYRDGVLSARGSNVNLTLGGAEVLYSLLFPDLSTIEGEGWTISRSTGINWYCADGPIKMVCRLDAENIWSDDPPGSLGAVQPSTQALKGEPNLSMQWSDCVVAYRVDKRLVELPLSCSQKDLFIRLVQMQVGETAQLDELKVTRESIARFHGSFQRGGMTVTDLSFDLREL